MSCKIDYATLFYAVCAMRAHARGGRTLWARAGLTLHLRPMSKSEHCSSKFLPEQKRPCIANIEVAEKVHTVLTKPRIFRYSVLQTRSKSSQIWVWYIFNIRMRTCSWRHSRMRRPVPYGSISGPECVLTGAGDWLPAPSGASNLKSWVKLTSWMPPFDIFPFRYFQ